MKKLEYLRDDEGFIDISTFNIEKLKTLLKEPTSWIVS